MTVVRTLHQRGDELAADTANGFNRLAIATVPVDTGRLGESHEVTQLGHGRYQQRVGMFYGIYVDRGTRHMAPRAWWSQAWLGTKGTFRLAAVKKELFG